MLRVRWLLPNPFLNQIKNSKPLPKLSVQYLIVNKANYIIGFVNFFANLFQAKLNNRTANYIKVTVPIEKLHLKGILVNMESGRFIEWSFALALNLEKYTQHV